MTNSYLVSLIVVIADRDSRKELHSEIVAFLFEDGERSYFRGVDTTAYYDHDSMVYWTRVNTDSLLSDMWKSKIFRTNNQRRKLQDLQKAIRSNKNWYIDAVVADTQSGTKEEMLAALRVLQNDPANVMWQGKFV